MRVSAIIASGDLNPNAMRVMKLMKDKVNVGGLLPLVLPEIGFDELELFQREAGCELHERKPIRQALKM